MNTARRLRAFAVVACAGALLAGIAGAPANARMPAPRIKVMSNRADLVFGGDAFVRVTLPRGVKASRLRLRAGRRGVTRVLHRTGRRRLEGVVRRLRVGRIPLVARIRHGGAARLIVTNHRIGGPVFAGSQGPAVDVPDRGEGRQVQPEAIVQVPVPAKRRAYRWRHPARHQHERQRRPVPALRPEQPPSR